MFEGKEAGQVIELRVQPLPMPLGRVTLGLSVFGLRLYAVEEIEKETLAIGREGCEGWREGCAFVCGGGRIKRLCACVCVCHFLVWAREEDMPVLVWKVKSGQVKKCLCLWEEE